MPFINPNWRNEVDEEIDQTAINIRDNLAKIDVDFMKPGVLAYCVYRFMLHFVGERGWGNLTRVYTDVTLGAGEYFKQREIDPYEQEKEDENGPVYVSRLDHVFDDEIPFP